MQDCALLHVARRGRFQLLAADAGVLRAASQSEGPWRARASTAKFFQGAQVKTGCTSV